MKNKLIFFITALMLIVPTMYFFFLNFSNNSMDTELIYSELTLQEITFDDYLYSINKFTADNTIYKATIKPISIFFDIEVNNQTKINMECVALLEEKNSLKLINQKSFFVTNLKSNNTKFILNTTSVTLTNNGRNISLLGRGRLTKKRFLKRDLIQIISMQHTWEDISLDSL